LNAIVRITVVVPAPAKVIVGAIIGPALVGYITIVLTPAIVVGVSDVGLTIVRPTRVGVTAVV
jgi:hypothetical protein